MSSKDDYAKRFADSLRAAADLIERGLIECEAQIEYDIERRPDWRTGLEKVRHTGHQTVTVVMRGNPRDFSTTGWANGQTALPSENRLLPSADQESVDQ